MSYKLNSEAYLLFTQIEVGIREFMITIIKNMGVHEWTRNFLGKIHLESLKVIGKRIHEAYEQDIEPEISDIYLSKINRELKIKKETFKNTKLLHPFYYLNWADLESLLNKSPNQEIINETIGELNRDIVSSNLSALNFLRNDIAHSRFITEVDYKFIRSSFDQISAVIPNFSSLCESQYSEETIESLFENLNGNICNIESKVMLDNCEIDKTEISIQKCLDSFWINSFFINKIPLIEQLDQQMGIYKKLRTTPGGLLDIQKWKNLNLELLANVKKIKNG